MEVAKSFVAPVGKDTCEWFLGIGASTNASSTFPLPTASPREYSSHSISCLPSQSMAALSTPRTGAKTAEPALTSCEVSKGQFEDRHMTFRW